MIGSDPYYSRSEVSNSDLSTLKNYFMPQSYVMDATQAYRFGNLVDAMITEPHRVDHYRMRVDSEQFLAAEWEVAKSMKYSYQRDPFCKQFDTLCGGQVIKFKKVELQYGGVKFSLWMRCKYDRWANLLNYGGDIKSTTATTQAQFEAACQHFDYDRQRAVYMTIADAQKDVLIGISKVKPHKVFKIFINRESEFFRTGMEKFTELAFRYWTLF